MKEENTKTAGKKKNKAATKRKKVSDKNLQYMAIIGIPVIVIALVIIVAVIGKNATVIEFDYSKGLNENGTIAGVASAKDYVELCDVRNIVIPEEEVAMTDEEWESHLNSILKENDVEELTDEIVAEKYGENASTVEEYEQYVRKTAKEENIKTYVLDYVVTNSTLKSTPKKYYKIVKKNLDAQYKSTFMYYNSLYYQILGYYNWNSYLDYYQMSRSEYKKMLKEASENQVKENLVLQAIYEELGLTVTDEDFTKALYEAGYEKEDDINTAVENYGRPFWNQYTISYKTIDTLSDLAVVKEGTSTPE